jgi:hypothetical protein
MYKMGCKDSVFLEKRLIINEKIYFLDKKIEKGEPFYFQATLVFRVDQRETEQDVRATVEQLISIIMKSLLKTV